MQREPGYAVGRVLENGPDNPVAYFGVSIKPVEAEYLINSLRLAPFDPPPRIGLYLRVEGIASVGKTAHGVPRFLGMRGPNRQAALRAMSIERDICPLTEIQSSVTMKRGDVLARQSPPPLQEQSIRPAEEIEFRVL